MAGLIGKLRLLVSRAVLTLVKDDPKLQEVQLALLDGESRARAERFQQYGFTSVPQAGAEAIAVAVGGSRSHLVVLAVDDRRYRKGGLQAGEVAIYTDQGDFIHIQRGGTILVQAATKVRIESPRVEISGDLHVEGGITCDNDVSDANGSMQEVRDTYNSHTHAGVQGGSSSTAVPSQEMD